MTVTSGPNAWFPCAWSEVVVRVDEGGHRLVGEALDGVEQCPRRHWGDVRVDDHDVFLVHYHHGIAHQVDRADLTDEVDARGDLFEAVTLCLIILRQHLRAEGRAL